MTPTQKAPAKTPTTTKRTAAKSGAAPATPLTGGITTRSRARQTSRE